MTATPATPAAAAKPAAAKTAKTAKTARPKEDKAARFRRLAPPRVSKAVTALRRVETIARSPGYEFSTEQANKLMAYLDEAVDRVRQALVARTAGRKAESEIIL